MVKVLIGAGSAIERSVEKEIISASSLLELAGDAANQAELEKKIESLKPNFLLLDSDIFNEERLDLVIYKLKAYHLPILLLVDEKSLGLHTPGDITLIKKPDFITMSKNDIASFGEEIFSVIKNHEKSFSFGMTGKKLKLPEDNSPESSEKCKKGQFKVVLVGVSTGGPGTVHTLLNTIGPNFPLPILITQHIDSFFDKNLITWLNTNCPLPVHLVTEPVVPQNGNVYFAPTDYHLVLQKGTDGEEWHIELNHDEPVNFLRPAVDKMFDSAVKVLGSKILAVLLTGMGSDGADGCLRVKKAGGYTITESEKSCVVYGMPKAAVDCGGSCEILDLEKIADRLWELSGGSR
ncbi:MAG: hypothetical protein K6G52_00035 [Treponemataceae bacterium]|nr:hypothetical protein [Treponemataceae bacterium]